MSKPSILKEEILYYIEDEWNTSLKEYDGGLWLTTRALQEKLKERGLITTWPTLALRLEALHKHGKIKKIYTSNGSCWSPVGDTLNI